jgi:hypothetical protein
MNRFPFASVAKGKLRIAEKREVATAILPSILPSLSRRNFHLNPAQIPFDKTFCQGES